MVDDDARRSYQGYAIVDYSNDGKGGSSFFELQIATEDKVDDFIHGNGIVQSFDRRTSKVRSARLTHSVVGAAGYAFSFVVDRMSVTPGQCRAP